MISLCSIYDVEYRFGDTRRNYSKVLTTRHKESRDEVGALLVYNRLKEVRSRDTPDDRTRTVLARPRRKETVDQLQQNWSQTFWHAQWDKVRIFFS